MKCDSSVENLGVPCLNCGQVKGDKCLQKTCKHLRIQEWDSDGRYWRKTVVVGDAVVECSGGQPFVK